MTALEEARQKRLAFEARQAADREREDQIWALLAELGDALPAPRQVVWHKKHGGVYFDGRAEPGWRERIQELLELFPALPLWRVKDSCLSFTPDHPGTTSASITAVCPWTIRVYRVSTGTCDCAPEFRGGIRGPRQVSTYPASAEVTWWTDLGSVRIQVQVRIEQARAVGFDIQGGQKVVPFSGYQVDTYWAPADHPNPFGIWWPLGFRQEDWMAVTEPDQEKK